MLIHTLKASTRQELKRLGLLAALMLPLQAAVRTDMPQ
jgi:hypothetical protein